MALFFITTVMKNNERPFQFHFDTDEASTIEQLADLFEHGKIVKGERFHRRDPDTGRSEIAISGPMVGMIQMSTPIPSATA